ncbi:hypothetical protein [Nocardioides sp. YIM 152315]|uniref:hypothetical protein n=1 Tax=Nocardioides sp. YIM 152315 TaxID=3031760 RepID=UPI0023DBE4D5|nr:hypothetical protein [Nocardioides sp. YIM 152315]MDF1602738.1 hypothetical protein [Nocardioides sp. YIM 152315]
MTADILTAQNWGALTLVLLAFALACSLAAWASAGRRIWVPAALVLVAAAAAVAAAPERVAVEGNAAATLLMALGGAVAVAGGGPATALVFDLVDRREPPTESLDRAGHVLRGGAWIGALERLATFATLVAGWPEGLAVVLALKGLGRYPELRAAEDGVRTGAAERFIIGTFTSVLWACAAAGVVALVSTT